MLLSKGLKYLKAGRQCACNPRPALLRQDGRQCWSHMAKHSSSAPGGSKHPTCRGLLSTPSSSSALEELWLQEVTTSAGLGLLQPPVPATQQQVSTQTILTAQSALKRGPLPSWWITNSPLLHTFTESWGENSSAFYRMPFSSEDACTFCKQPIITTSLQLEGIFKGHLDQHPSFLAQMWNWLTENSNTI